MLEVIFSRKTFKSAHAPYFNNASVKLTHVQMHLGLQLDNKLWFNEYIHNEISKETKGIGLLPKLQTILSSRNLLTIDKSFIGPNLDHGHVIYDQPFKASFSNKIELVLYNAGTQ